VSESKPTVLAIRVRQLGDVLVTLGALREIQRAAPDHRIAFIVDAAYHGLLSNVDYIDELLPAPPHMEGLKGARAYSAYVGGLRATRLACVLDFHSSSRTAILSYLSGAGVRIGFDVRARKLLYTDVAPRATFHDGRIVARNSHDSAVALARRWLPSIDNGSAENTIVVPESEIERGRELLRGLGIPAEQIETGVVLINPGNPYPAKEWPERSFVELARRLHRSERAIVIACGPGEEARAGRIAEAAGDGVWVGPSLDLREVPGFVRAASGLVTIDSGLKHLAVAVGTPTVTLFGPTSPAEWHMGGHRHRALYVDLSCSPCRLLDCPFGTPPCMTRLTPDAVLEALDDVEGQVRVQ
jgi:heptosyltransferase-1